MAKENHLSNRSRHRGSKKILNETNLEEETDLESRKCQKEVVEITRFSQPAKDGETQNWKFLFNKSFSFFYSNEENQNLTIINESRKNTKTQKSKIKNLSKKQSSIFWSKRQVGLIIYILVQSFLTGLNSLIFIVERGNEYLILHICYTLICVCAFAMSITAIRGTGLRRRNFVISASAF